MGDIVLLLSAFERDRDWDTYRGTHFVWGGNALRHREGGTGHRHCCRKGEQWGFEWKLPAEEGWAEIRHSLYKQQSPGWVQFKVTCTSGPIFEKKKYEAVPHIFSTNNEISDWLNA